MPNQPTSSEPQPATEHRDDDARPRRRAYEAPRIESGDAFERVHLASNCNEFSPFEGCDIIC